MRLSSATQKAVVMLAVVSVTAFVAQRPALRWLGNALVVTEELTPADIAVGTIEADPAGALELADLFSARLVPRVAVLVPAPTAAAAELSRRGVVLESPTDVLQKLGVPASALVSIDAGEGGTTEATTALASWSRVNGIRRLIVVTGATHSRRVQRVLRRQLGDRGPVVLIRIPRTDSFRPSDWWQHRGTLRSGIIELQKLLLDLARHPLG